VRAMLRALPLTPQNPSRRCYRPTLPVMARTPRAWASGKSVVLSCRACSRTVCTLRTTHLLTPQIPRTAG